MSPTALLACIVFLPQATQSTPQKQTKQEPALLTAGKSVSGEIVDRDAVVESPTLKSAYTDAPVLAKRFRFVADKPGPWTIELRSYFFDAYLVLRDAKGTVIDENDDGPVGTHACIVVDGRKAGETLLVDACALHGGRGRFELKLTAGRPAPVTGQAAFRLVVEDAIAAERATREVAGESSLGHARALVRLAVVQHQIGRAAEARASFERALAIQEKALGPEDLEVANTLYELAFVLMQHGDFAAAQAPCERALAIREKFRGPDDALVAQCLIDLGSLLQHLGKFEEAKARLERALAITEKIYGPDGVETAVSLYSLSFLLIEQKEFEKAQPLCERALAIKERLLRPDDESIARSLGDLATLLTAKEEFEKARPLFERALRIFEAARGPDAMETGQALNNLGGLLRETGKFEEAEPLLQRALAIYGRNLSPHHPDQALVLHNLATVLHARGKLAEARPLYERAIAIYDESPGRYDLQVATTADELAALLVKLGEYDPARPLAERALAIREKVLGPDDVLTTTSMCSLAALLRVLREDAAAQRLFERVLAIRERTLGADHVSLGVVLNGLGLVLVSEGDFPEATRAFERSLALAEKESGAESPNVATALDNLSGLHQHLGNYAEARRLGERALAIREKTSGPDGADTAITLNNLGNLLQKTGRYAEARKLLERALAILQKHAGPDHPDTATTLNNLALLLESQGDNDEARPLLEQVLKSSEKTYGPDSVQTASSLNNLAELLRTDGKPDEARPLLERALAIHEKHPDQELPMAAICLNNMGELLRMQGRFDEARPFYDRSLAIKGKVLGPDHPSTSTTLNNLASLLLEQGKFDEALPLFERALAVVEKALGPEHPDTLRTRGNLALHCLDLGQVDRAFELAKQATATRSALLLRELDCLAEWERVQWAATQFKYLGSLIGLVAGASTPARELLAYDLVLAGKGSVGRSLVQSQQRVLASLDPKSREQLAALRAVQSDLSAETSRRDAGDPAAREQRLAALRERRGSLERALAQSLGKSDEAATPDAAAIAAALPKGSALVDFLVHRIYQPAEVEKGKVVRIGGMTAPVVSAWITRAGATGGVRVGLGDAAALQAAVTAWLDSLTAARGAAPASSGGPGPEEAAGRRLRELLWDPLAPHVGDAGLVFVSPDRFLGTLPFETLVAADGRFLIETRKFVYVSDAPSLVALAAHGAAPGAARGGSLLAVGGIDYDARAALDRAAAPLDVVAFGETRGGFQNRWEKLRWSAKETAVVADLHASLAPRDGAVKSGDGILEGAAATEEALKRALPGKRFIHLATHGFFQPAGLPSMWDQARSEIDGAPAGAGRVSSEMKRVAGLMPGLLSGLVCSGANLPAEAGRDNGLLTAEEVTWLDLTACDLVVLSACQTGLGSERGGEGMKSLQQSFHLAGAKTVVSSLWNVDDEATSTLMRGFYDHLWREGRSKLDALHQAQLDLLNQNRAARGGRALPYTWGAFVLSGDWR